MRRAVMAGWVVLALGHAGCSCGEGGTVTVPCDETRCGESCVAGGSESGSCRDDACVCRPHLDVPPGPTTGLSSGGAVVRRGGGFQLEITVGPVAPAGAGSSASRDVELGVQPQTDPERLLQP